MTPKSPAAACRALLLSALCLSLAAQEATPEPAGDRPPESWAAEAQPVALARTPGQVVVFTEEDLQRSGARTLGAFLVRELPSQVQNEGGPGLPSRVYLGGSRPQDTVVLVDGVPLMDPGRLGQDLNEIPLLGIARVEVLTGAPGAGAGGSGGTIALYTGRPLKPGVSGDLSGLGGNQGQGQSTATPGFAWEGGYLRGGNLSAREQQATPTDRPYRQVTNFLNLGQQWGATVWSLGWRGTAFGVPQPYEEVTDASRIYNPARESRQRSDSGQLRVDWALAPNLTLETILALARFRHEQPPPGSAEPSAFEGRQTWFQSVLHLKTGARSGLSLRVEAQDAQQDGDLNPAILGRASGRQVGLGLEWRFEPRPGLRFLGQARATSDRQSTDVAGVSTEVLSTSGHTLRLGFTQDLGAGLRLYGAAASNRSAPTLLQQLRNAQVAGTASLGMETTASLQLGLGWGRGNWYGKLETQQQRGQDLIGLSGSTYVNQDRLQTRATEAALGWRTARKLGVEAFLRAQEARDLQAPSDQAFATLASERRPFSAHGLKGFMGWGRVQAELHYTLQGHQYSTYGESAGRAATNGLPPVIRPTQVVYRTVGMTTTVTAGRHLTLILRGENLLQPRTSPEAWAGQVKEGQSDAYLVDGYPAAPPTYSLEARYRF